ncbi:MAG: hypothetical protein QXQ64_08415 [Candidatus Bathyarchaeia archaeon]|nr:hypothetical protein [Candidatus Bathyarchaeota archaeon]
MKETIEAFKAKYKRFLEGWDEDPSALKAEAEKLLAEVKAKGEQSFARELEEILIDLTLSIEETKCHCHMANRCRC